ncbi:hypothetical protein SAMD00019534_018880 [Acytostelium subglobosum LB1]|uniref:hypothetical protein n=1 Tax=Acytostelium subglobosum LB1 TaxID=1410327 RepID=UPI0006449A15|nr:hypothetical protein SAMD00019534_018880 [Acytostelium subglobosum LB1]GAM18713.1 hypothetical protein SAMD00019534_018880 [Acytostelium subglobosum LB1]|eukprot:XP_012757933.1 hypothetical protein SAMD00019534_018880 [Acytostelium subglobosum LB1]
MIDNKDEYKWDGYDHMMSSKPNMGKPDPKASIFDLNNMRDSVLFEKDRFSFCLSPPKDPSKYKTFSQPQSKSHAQPMPMGGARVQQQQQQKENIPINSNQRMAPPMAMTKQQMVSQPMPINAVKKVTTQPITIPSQQTQQQQPQQQQKVTSPMYQSPVKTNTLTKVPSSPIKSTTMKTQPQSPQKPSMMKKETVQSLSDVNLDNMYLTNNVDYNMSVNGVVAAPLPNNRPVPMFGSRPATPTQQLPNVPSITTQPLMVGSAPTRPGMLSRPATPTQQLTNIQSPPQQSAPSLNKRPVTPTKMEPLALPVATKPSATQKEADSISIVAEAKLESRIKNLEMENRVLKQQMQEKDRSMEQLHDRIEDLESQVKNFMEEIKLFLLNNIEEK